VTRRLDGAVTEDFAVSAPSRQIRRQIRPEASVRICRADAVRMPHGSCVPLGNFVIIYVFQAQFELAHQDPSSNYNTLINSTLDICGFFNGTKNNPLSNFFFNAFKDSLPKSLF
jgi:hypothetical protein